MRKQLLIVLITIMLSSALFAAEQNPVIYISADDRAYIPEVIGVYVTFNLNILTNLGTYERAGMRFALEIPENIVSASSISYNPDIVQSAVGNFTEGLDIIFNGCYSGWNLVCSQTYMITGSERSEVLLIEHPDGGRGYYTCGELELRETCYCPLAINFGVSMKYMIPRCPEVESETTTWGAIKSFYGD
ncbi:MAG: hypothetical protein GF417_00930 [Candidatus Latescibacteria bacterium]|nr:hypothetical protein [bacterium]MBD3422990.1 hypothetical protein [Candidatus Latescibacterota bacterium]